MQRWLIILIAFLLLVPGLAAAKEKTVKPAPQTAAESPAPPPGGLCMVPPGPEMMMGMMEKWWHLGAMSQAVSGMLAKSSAILNRGALTADGQKQLAGVMNQLGELVQVVFSPKPVEKPAEVQKKLKDLDAVLDKLAAPTKKGK